LDPLVPDKGPFLYALEWACRLRLPLHALIGPDRDACKEGTPPTAADRVSACTRVAAQRGVLWETTRWESDAVDRIPHVVGPADLFVASSALPETEKRHLFRYGLRHSKAAVLLCPSNWNTLSRVLVLHDDRPYQESFLASAIALCRRWQAKPIILTVARSERRASLRQHFLEEILAHSGTDCDFDMLVGADVGVAVAQVMRWRQCPLVMMERQGAPPWWRWWQSETAERFLGLANDCSLLALPGSNVLVSAAGTRDKAPASQASFYIPTIR
jgi:hypothetical protein